MWSLIRLTSLHWCCIKSYTHSFTPAPPATPRTTWASGVINVSVIQGCVGGTRQGRWAAAARLGADISGRRVSDVSLLLPGGGGGRGSGSAQSSGLGERSLLSLVWLIREEAECPRCHYQYPWPPAAPTAYAVGGRRKKKKNMDAVIQVHTPT